MSAESPRRPGLNKPAHVVSPQPISDRSIIDSVAGIINDIVPQAYTSSSPSSDNRETITWARFEYADVNDSAFFPDYNEGSSIPPLLLVLGYATGVQVWLIAASGEATEVLSWRQGMVRTLRLLPSPKSGERERADSYRLKRPLVAICDSAGPGPQFCSVSFISLKTGEQVKSIKFKSPVCDVLANKRSIVVTFPEKIAVFDAPTLEDVLTITTCYPSPGPNPNPVALGTRWLAYSEKKLIPAKRSSGGCEGEGVSSYTATVLYAAKSLGKGLRGLGETVASSLTGTSVSPVSTVNNANAAEASQPGVVTILDLQAAKEEREKDDNSVETIIAHFTAHGDAIVAMTFDQTGALLMTADKRGHDFHVFRIQPHPGGSSLAAVHHLYVLHRGDTTAKVQDMAFSSDARWAAISTLRGTTHVFPVAPYGGPVGVRTHSSPHVVNRLSRFHRSAGLTDDGTRSHSPISHAEPPLSVYPYTNPRLPPYPHPTVLHPLAQIRQPSSLNHVTSQAQPRVQQRQRLHSDDGVTLPLKICACFAPPRAWIYAQRDATNKLTKRAVDSLFVMACHGNMIQYDLDPKAASGIPKEKVCDETSIELEVEAKGQWPLQRNITSSDIVPPLQSTSPLMATILTPLNEQQTNGNESRWLSQVEIFTHAGPHRRLWMGPQFVFKTYNAPSGVAANLVEAETVEIGIASGSRPARSNPVNMPHAGSRPLVPVVIDGSGSSYEQSPRFVEAYGDALDNESIAVMGSGENQLREDLAEAMLETSSTPHRVAGRRMLVERVGQPVAKVVNPLGTVITVSADEEESSSSGCGPGSSQLHQQDSATTISISSTEDDSPPSICAEEGKCSSAAELESHTLKENTQICAEMRPAGEPSSIDSVPDSSIEDLRLERRSLCAEARSLSRVEIERVGCSRDVPPSSPSLCAERGAVPDCSNVVVVAPAPPIAALRKQKQQQQMSSDSGYQLVPPPQPSSVSSDDDLVHVGKEELPQVEDKKTAAVSDDDIEHVLLADVVQPPISSHHRAAEKRSSPGAEGRGGRKRSKEKQQQTLVAVEPALPATLPPPELEPPAPPQEQDISSDMIEIINMDAPQPMVEQQPESAEVDISSDMVEIINLDAEQSLQESQQPKQSTEIDISADMVEIINMGDPPPPLPESAPPSSTNCMSDMVEIINMDEPLPVERVEVVEPPTAAPNIVEIIDIDAEKSSGSYVNASQPECTILEDPPEARVIVKRKYKRQSKREPLLQQHQQLPPAQPPPPPPPTDDVSESVVESSVVEPLADVQVETQPSAENNSWSSILRCKSESPSRAEEIKCEPLVELKDTEDDLEANKENVDISNEDLEQSNKDETVTYNLELSSKKQSSIEEVALDEMVCELKQQHIEHEVPEKKSDEEQEVANLIPVERSSSSDEINVSANLVVVPMDTEDSSLGGARQDHLLLEALSEKNLVQVGASPVPTMLPVLPAKKASRSKKKKRR
ncbi:hypothetical protein QAD02_012001 [Eretmocerus hayati]|uniref:Uncharacterized protein n=1 Tax=Eretmocerus hayati TaxID=131215 RepID=A0ACC2P356_9HYME|nr:hypothetical protein QAD02_012001 [Eretmocerus hayati]